MASLWSESARVLREEPERGRLEGNVKTEALVIGGGMAGVLCAHALAQRGVACVVAEAGRLGGGVTGNTTAKITAQHGLIYDKLLKKLGLERALGYYAAQQRALAAYREMAEQFPCDLEERTAFVYSVDHPAKLEREANAYHQLGIPMDYREHPSLPVRTVGALGMPRQAQFHPLRLLLGVARGLDVYERTLVTRIEGNTAFTEHGSITARHIVLATHYPMINIPGLYFMKLYQHRSYVIALSGASALDGMYVDEREDGHSFRDYQDLLLIGGGDHRTGRRGGGWSELRRLAADVYPGAQERYAWATQDAMSLDGMPYIGRHRSKTARLYVATGFNKWGMTGSMVAAEVLADLIARGGSELAELFSPQRSMAHPQLLLNAGSAVAGYLSFGKRCTHMGCALHRNLAEGSMDCSCHGSRFDEAGRVIDNPAIRNLR